MRATRLIEKLSRKVVTERVKLRQLPRRFSRRPLRRRGGKLLDGEGLCVWGGELQFFALGIVAKPQLAGPQG